MFSPTETKLLVTPLCKTFQNLASFCLKLPTYLPQFDCPFLASLANSYPASTNEFEEESAPDLPEKRGWTNFHSGGYGKRGWNSFAGGYGKRAFDYVS